MRILGLVSSPRRFGNSELAVKEILRRLPDTWDKRMIRLSDMNLIPCKACYACLSQAGNACVLADDMNFVLQHMLQADKIIIAAPCYILGAHIGVQRLIDRLMPMMEKHLCFADKQCALLVFHGLPGWEGMAPEEMLKIPQVLGMNLAGAAALEATLPGDSVRGQNLQRLHALAEMLLGTRPAEIYPPEDGALLCPYCHSRLLTVKSDRSWRCVLCDGRGLVTAGEAGLALETDSAAGHRFSNDRRIAHMRRLQDAKQEFIARRAEIKHMQQDYPDGDLWIRPL
ncbi:MAG: flavodoxin family protein [Clostridiales Family XIII bacterium]|jgi:multimeric flavodoxin WrbA|nr:flavodoxin family protein [Clostridiales Family XIII bacterium]